MLVPEIKGLINALIWFSRRNYYVFWCVINKLITTIKYKYNTTLFFNKKSIHKKFLRNRGYETILKSLNATSTTWQKFDEKNIIDR